jgi:hypothetical protein
LGFENASPEGRGCREAAGEGYNNERTLKKEISVVPLTRPAAAGHPLPLGEGFTQKHFSIRTTKPILLPTIAGDLK